MILIINKDLKEKFLEQKNKNIKFIKVDVMRNDRYLLTYKYFYNNKKVIYEDLIRKELESKFSWLKNQNYELCF